LQTSLSRRWRWILLSFALALLVAEIALRLTLGNLAVSLLFHIRPADGRCVGLEPGLTVEHTGFFLRTRPFRMEVNELGYRGPARPREHPPGVLRVAVLGNSFVYGMGVGTDESIPANLERALAKRLGRPVEVLNFGIPGMAATDFGEQFDLFAAQWHPDVAVFLEEGGDLALVHGENSAPRSLCMMTEASWFERYAVHYCYLCRLPLAFSVMRDNQRKREHPPARALMRGILDRLRRQVEAKGARLAVVAIRHFPSLADGTAADVLTELGIDHTDVSLDRDDHIIPRDGHYDAVGTEIVAERIAAWFPADLLGPVTAGTHGVAQ
jgi:hypothetical protein